VTNPPPSVLLTAEEGEALIDRVYASNLPHTDCRVLVQIVRLHFWLLLAIQETKLSLKRFRQMLFGEPAKGRTASVSSAPSTEAEKDERNASPAGDRGQASREPRQRGGHRPGQGRLGADAYVGAERIKCRHEELSLGDRCPVCGYGTLYRLPAGVAIRINGNALLSAIRYELEKLRCSACGAIFSAKLPDGVGADKYSPRARATLALGRYLLGLPFHRLESYQAMLGVPVSDSTQWDQIEELADGV
jgi:transposase